MSEAIKVEIVSPENLVFSKEANSITVPGSEGYFTVMGEHAPFMTILKPGFVTVEQDKDKTSFYVGGGFADVSTEGVTILAEIAKTGADYSHEEIQSEILAAKESLKKAEGHEEISAAQALLDGFTNLADEIKHMKPSGF